MVIDGKDFTDLTPGEAALKLHHMKGADMLWHFGILFLVIAALFTAGVPAVIAAFAQYPFIFMAISNCDTAHDRRWEEWMDGFGRSMANNKHQGGEA